MVSCIIVDDEYNGRVLLQSILQKYCTENIIILDLCSGLQEAISSIKLHRPNIVFIDIEMPVYSGIELTKYINPTEYNFDIIYTTAHTSYAIQALKNDAFDYLLKPIQHKALIQTVERYITKNKTQQLNTTINNKICITSQSNTHFIDLNKTLYFQQLNNTVIITLYDESKITIENTLAEIYIILNKTNHNLIYCDDIIINPNFISELINKPNAIIKFNNNTELPIPNAVSENIFNAIRNKYFNT